MTDMLNILFWIWLTFASIVTVLAVIVVVVFCIDNHFGEKDMETEQYGDG